MKISFDAIVKELEGLKTFEEVSAYSKKFWEEHQGLTEKQEKALKLIFQRRNSELLTKQIAESATRSIRGVAND